MHFKILYKLRSGIQISDIRNHLQTKKSLYKEKETESFPPALRGIQEGYRRIAAVLLLRFNWSGQSGSGLHYSAGIADITRAATNRLWMAAQMLHSGIWGPIWVKRGDSCCYLVMTICAGREMAEQMADFCFSLLSFGIPSCESKELTPTTTDPVMFLQHLYCH